MYHIKGDKRSVRSAEVIGKALYDVCKTMPLHEVTVSDIHRVCGISRTTFYRLFDSPSDVLFYLCQQHTQRLVDYYEAHSSQDIPELVMASIRISMENYELLEILVNNHRIDLLNEMYASNFKDINLRVPVVPSLDDMTYDYVQSLQYAAVSNTLATWIRRGRVETPEQLYAVTTVYGEVIRHIFDVQNKMK